MQTNWYSHFVTTVPPGINSNKAVARSYTTDVPVKFFKNKDLSN